MANQIHIRDVLVDANFLQSSDSFGVDLEIFVQLDNKRFNLEWELVGMDDVCSASYSNDLTAQGFFQAKEEVLLTLASCATKVCRAVVSPESTYFVQNVPKLPNLHDRIPNRF